MKLITAKAHHSPSVFIQSKGLHAGRPLRHYIPNSFSLFSQDPVIFHKCFLIWKSKAYQEYIIGSVVPFVRLKDTKKILELYLSALDKVEVAHIQLVANIEDLIRIKEQQVIKLKQMQLVKAHQILSMLE